MIRNSRIILLSAACVLIACFAVADEQSCTDKPQEKQAADKEQCQKAFFEMVDDNKDNKITKVEFCNHVFETSFK